MIRLALHGKEGPEHRTFRRPSITIGRGGACDLALPDVRGLSRHHCRLSVTGPREGRIEDLGSRNRTLVNGHVVDDALLSEGDHVVCGGLTFNVEVLSDDEPTAELLRPCLHCGHVFTERSPACPRCGTRTEAEGRGRRMTETTFPGFRLRRKIGTGGMGVVFEAHHLERDEIVALKVLRPHLGRDPDFVAQFIEEIRLLSALRHPAIVQVLGHGHDRDLHYIAMERVAGRSVREALRESKRLGGERASRITWEAAMALNAAHQQAAIIHGDVKPGNMLLDAQGRVKLCDFGLASVEQRARVRAHKTSSLERRGTAAYAAPERFTAQGAPSIQGDAYALGVSLFQMLTGRLPFTAGDVAGLARAHREAPVPLLAESGGPDHPALQILVERLLAKDPRRRMRDWPTLISDLALLVP